MDAKLYFNKSDKRYINKDIEQIHPHESIAEWLQVEFIEPTSIVNPRLIFSTESNVLQANYLFLKDFGRYYYINNHTLEHGRVIVECHVDVLMSFSKDILDENVVLNRGNRDMSNMYLNDDKLKMYNYSLFKTINFKPQGNVYFDENKEQLVMVCSGSV